MKGSLAASLAFHAAILIAALVVLPSPRNEAPLVEAIQVDISNIGDVTKKMAMAADAEKVEKPKGKKAEIIKKADPAAVIDKEEKKTKEAKAAPPPEPEQPKQEEQKKAEPPKPAEPKKEAEPKPPDPEPLKDLIKDTVMADEAAAKAAEQKKIEEQKKAEEKKKADEKKKAEEKKKLEAKKAAEAKKKAEKLDVAKLEDILNSDALLDKDSNKKTTNASESTADGTPTKGEANLQGADDQLVGTIIDALVSKVKQCWSVPPGAREANMSIKVHFQLNQDGTLIGTPDVQNYSADPIFDATARSAVAALIQCQAYELPQDRYDLWKDNTLDFNPNLMFQG